MIRDFARSWVLPFVDPRQIAAIARLPRFFAEWRQFRRLSGMPSARFADLRPCLVDRTGYTPFDPHYFYQAAWLARELSARRPAYHVDIGSSVVAAGILSAFVPLVFIDYRPLQIQLTGVTSVGGDITQLPLKENSLLSLSSMHVVEHIGLGRYGDAINPDGTFAALRELARVLAPGGHLYLATPVGRERVCFNAHRVFSPRTIVNALSTLKMVRFALIDDNGRFDEEGDFVRAQRLSYGCGLFCFTK